MVAFLSCLCISQALDVSVSSKGVIFVKEPAVAFSKSSWTLVSELTTQPAREVVNRLVSWLDQPAVANRNPPNRFTSLLQEKASQTMKLLRQQTSAITDKLTALDLITRDAPRTRRAIMDGGKRILEWLFGTATNENLAKTNEEVNKLSNQEQEITHLLAEQATVNETIWESRLELNLINKLSHQATSLNFSTGI